MDIATVDKLLTTTRSVRKRLDFSKPVGKGVIEECLRIAIQAPTGSNMQGWHFLIITDAQKKAAVAEYYKKAFHIYATAPESGRLVIGPEDPRYEQQQRIIASATYLADHMHEVPVLVIPAVEGRAENAGPLVQASLYGSILPAAWSFILALRSRGLGSAWTTLHLMFEKEVAKALGIPDHITQAALLPVAYYTGTDFKPAERLPIQNRLHWNGWSA